MNPTNTDRTEPLDVNKHDEMLQPSTEVGSKVDTDQHYTTLVDGDTSGNKIQCFDTADTPLSPGVGFLRSVGDSKCASIEPLPAGHAEQDLKSEGV